MLRRVVICFASHVMVGLFLLCRDGFGYVMPVMSCCVQSFLAGARRVRPVKVSHAMASRVKLCSVEVCQSCWVHLWRALSC